MQRFTGSTLKLSDLGEKRIISEIIRPSSDDLRGDLPLNDDCQIFFNPNGTGVEKWAISTDRTPSDLRAFEWKLMTYFEYGRYSVTSNVSDLAAMGATPYGFLLNIAAPPDMLVDDFSSFFAGVVDALRNYDAKLLGGDTKQAKIFNSVGIAIGVCQESLLLRSSALAGDVVSVVGQKKLGLVPGAFAYFQNIRMFSSSEIQELDSIFKIALCNPRACVHEGKLISQAHPSAACIDNSDGLFESARELASASSVDISLNINISDVHPAVVKVAEVTNQDPIELAISAGGDFSLIISSKKGESLPCGSIEIGRVHSASKNPSVSFSDFNGNERNNVKGWVHFEENK